MFVKLVRFLALEALMALIIVGCGSQGDVFEVAVEPVAESAPTSVALGGVEPVVKAMVTGIGRGEVVSYVTTACTTADGLGGPPKCAAGEADGTMVQVFPNGGSESSFVRPEDIGNALNFMVKGLYAIYKAQPTVDQADYWPVGEYALLFERDQNDFPLPVVAIVQDGKLVRMEYYIGVQPADVLREIPVDQIIVGPQEAQALTAELLP